MIMRAAPRQKTGAVAAKLLACAGQFLIIGVRVTVINLMVVVMLMAVVVTVGLRKLKITRQFVSQPAATAGGARRA